MVKGEKKSSNQKCKPWISGQSKITALVTSKQCVLIQTLNSQHKLSYISLKCYFLWEKNELSVLRD